MNRATAPLVSAESSAALRGLFGWLEARYGGLPLDIGPSAEVVSSRSTVAPDDLRRLLRHEATALHVRGFYPPAAAAALGRRLAEEHAAGRARNWRVSTSRGLESSDVATLGAHDPYNVVAARGDPGGQDDYFAGVAKELHARRFPVQGDGAAAVVPQLWPLDLLRLQLDEAWASGAGLARERSGLKRPFGGGLTRVMKGPTRWKQGFIHVDEMGPLNSKRGLFSANIYLQLPTLPDNDETLTCDGFPKGGEQSVLRIWPVGIRSRWQWYRNALLLSGLSSQDAEAQMRLRAALGDAKNISVEPGDLVMICAQRPHEAIGFQHGTRVSLQCFIQHQGVDSRLLIDS